MSILEWMLKNFLDLMFMAGLIYAVYYGYNKYLEFQLKKAKIQQEIKKNEKKE